MSGKKDPYEFDYESPYKYSMASKRNKIILLCVLVIFVTVWVVGGYFVSRPPEKELVLVNHYTWEINDRIYTFDRSGNSLRIHISSTSGANPLTVYDLYLGQIIEYAGLEIQVLEVSNSALVLNLKLVY
jgi:hypothetical protein